jgi:hypothetical protein
VPTAMTPGSTVSAGIFVETVTFIPLATAVGA